MLPKNERLRRAKDFALLSQKGRVVYSPFYALRIRASQTPTKVGFVTSSKVFKTAVARNRGKRRMREVLRLLKSEWPKNMDLLFILKLELLKSTSKNLKPWSVDHLKKFRKPCKSPQLLANQKPAKNLPSFSKTKHEDHVSSTTLGSADDPPLSKNTLTRSRSLPGFISVPCL
jgi:ribonuclease P protein component